MRIKKCSLITAATFLLTLVYSTMVLGLSSAICGYSRPGETRIDWSIHSCATAVCCAKKGHPDEFLWVYYFPIKQCSEIGDSRTGSIFEISDKCDSSTRVFNTGAPTLEQAARELHPNGLSACKFDGSSC